MAWKYADELLKYLQAIKRSQYSGGKMNFRRLFLTLGPILFAAQTALAAPYVFTSPPREKPNQGEQDYGPIAAYLSKVTGQEFVYQHPRNWLSYMKDMQTGKYDLIFDGPHFVSWRVAKLNHTPLVRLPGGLDFVVIARKDNQKIQELDDLAGRFVCGHAPPNLATLTMQAQFPNPNRQPQVRVVRGFANAYKGLINKECDGAVIPSKVYNKLDKKDEKKTTRILFHSKPLPHQAFSADPRIPREIQDEIRRSLLAPEGVKATEKLRARFAGGKELLSTDRNEYEGFGYLLREIWGFQL